MPQLGQSTGKDTSCARHFLFKLVHTRSSLICACPGDLHLLRVARLDVPARDLIRLAALTEKMSDHACSTERARLRLTQQEAEEAIEALKAAQASGVGHRILIPEGDVALQFGRLTQPHRCTVTLGALCNAPDVSHSSLSEAQARWSELRSFSFFLEKMIPYKHRARVL